MMNTQVIDQIQEEVARKYGSNVLHLLNGSCMLEDFRLSGKIKEGCTYVPFNEAMCWGEADEMLFGEAFIERRINSLKSTKEEYTRIVLDPLKPLFEQKFDLIVMWFGEDMFCQINRVTVMGYLEQMGYSGELLLYMSCESMDEFAPKTYAVKLEGSLEIYRDIVCRQQMPVQELLPITYERVKLYLNYRDREGEISRYILENSGKDRQALVEDLLMRFSQYGLGDLQYEMMIEKLLQIH